MGAIQSFQNKQATADCLDSLSDVLWDDETSIDELWDSDDRFDDIKSSMNIIASTALLSEDDRSRIINIFAIDILEYYNRLINDDGFYELESWRIEDLKQERRVYYLKRRDKDHFFDENEHDANPVRWSKAAVWSHEETAALSLGKAPTTVNAASLQHIDDDHSWIASEYRYRLDLLNRSTLNGDIGVNQTPSEALNWLKKNDLSYPNRYDRLVDELSNSSEYCRDYSQYDAIIASLREEIDQLKSQIEKSRPNTKEKLSLYKIIMVMAAVKFRYKTIGNSGTARSIAEYSDRLFREYDLDVNLSQDKIKNTLSTAARELDLTIAEEVRFGDLSSVKNPKSDS